MEVLDAVLFQIFQAVNASIVENIGEQVDSQQTLIHAIAHGLVIAQKFAKSPRFVLLGFRNFLVKLFESVLKFQYVVDVVALHALCSQLFEFRLLLAQSFKSGHNVMRKIERQLVEVPSPIATPQLNMMGIFASALTLSVFTRLY